MKIMLIRHGKTEGNLSGRYIGVTDEPLCSEGISSIESVKNELSGISPDLIVTSPMKRCTETAEIIFGGAERLVCYDMRECDFGDFEGKNYAELNGNADYQAWIDSGGTIAFPNGESGADFRKRCADAFGKVIKEHKDSETAVFVVHGGTIMAVMERYAVPKGGFYDFMVKNGCGYECLLDTDKMEMTIEKRIGSEG